MQIYLASEHGITHRVRKRSFGDSEIYTETKKIRIDSISSVEEEKEISESEFQILSRNIRPGTRPVIKTRYTFDYKGVTFEIDMYPAWRRTAIMETELESREESVEMPDFIEIVREVTGQHRYSNSSMANNPSKEPV